VATGRRKGAVSELMGGTGTALGRAVGGGAHTEWHRSIEVVEDASGGGVRRR
jgi:hypothetical protein